MEVRKRNKVKPGSSGGGHGSSDRRKGSDGDTRTAVIDRGFTRAILAILVLLAGAVATLKMFPQHVPQELHKSINRALSAAGLEQKVHAVIIDAGSTGTRLLAFSFHKGMFDGMLHLNDELWLEVKPGLSSHAENPQEAARSIQGLLDQAKAKIPQSSWSSTPLTLKATAGLRLLPKEQSERIISEVEKTLRESGFKPDEPELVEIMNPMEEGLFAWFTVNILSERLSEPLGESFATLDLGGGSTQITFSPREQPSGLQGRKHFMHNVTVMGRNTEVYSHSYLGLGLMAAREAIFTSGAGEDVLELTSPCVNNKSPLVFNFHGKAYKISGKESSFENCAKIVNKVVNQGNVHAPAELAKRDIAAFSYFFDRALERSLIPKTTEGVLHVSHFVHEAHRACEAPESDFHCVDLAFISSLLTKGYGLPADKELYLLKKINGHETSWALGLAYNILEK